MADFKEITLTPKDNVKNLARDISRYLSAEGGRIAISYCPLDGDRTEFALRCAYSLAENKKTALLSGDVRTHALMHHLRCMYDIDDAHRRNLAFFSGRPIYPKYFRAYCQALRIETVVIDCINLMGINEIDLELLAQDLGVSILATRIIHER